MMRPSHLTAMLLIGVLTACSFDSLVVEQKDCLIDASYEINVKEIINSSCAYHPECHGQGSAYGEFHTYEKMRPFLNEQKFTDRVLVARNMPPDYADEVGGPTTLTSDQLEILRCWMEADFPN